MVRARFQPAIQLAPDPDSDPVPVPDPVDSAAPAKPAAQPLPLHGYKVLLLWLPAACDLTGTTVRLLCPRSRFTIRSFLAQLMNLGLLYTPVSIYQMTRGALVLFVGVLSVLFLHRRLWLYQFVLYYLYSCFFSC